MMIRIINAIHATAMEKQIFVNTTNRSVELKYLKINILNFNYIFVLKKKVSVKIV